MSSQLSFDATENFRKKLLVRNLAPYKEGYKGDEVAGDSEFTINDITVIDATNIEESAINENSQKRAFINNQYGPEGGYNQLIDIVDVKRRANEKSIYPDFIASVYGVASVLVNDNPTGTNGTLSEDSDLAKVGATQLQSELVYRVSEETYQQTLGRINILDALDDPFDALAIATGNEQVIESNWKISVPNNIVGKGLDFVSRITGIYSPYSWIPGSYFNKVTEQSGVSQASNASGSFSDRGTLNPEANRRASEQFLSNTGRGQTKRLFKSLSLNVYAPDYTDNSRVFGLKPPPGNYYIGSKESNVNDIVSPPNELPTDQYGNRVRTPVRGYGEIGKLYENSYPFKFALNGTKFLRNSTITNSSYDAPRLQGGFTWTSFEGIKAAGRNVSQGGALASVDPNFQSSVQSSWDGTVSTQYDLKAGSILDDTQRLINSAESLQGDARLQHVGNAISQVSKVFNDGVREMTKGSMVYKYEDASTGEIKGMEYCRVFTKDVPYFSNSELQKDEGMTTQNRKFTYSVLDNTYNLNIAPWRDKDSTNLQESKVKKYMFSIENLAWRTSSKPGFTYQDLPICERGPNGGRIMWFPPYDMKVSETNSSNWTANEFLGRPEPIYTYNNTTRQGSLSWKIIVDHPSILNAIVDKELTGENSQKVNDIVDSFFAGCRTYDIYELATKFPQFTLKDIYQIVTKTKDIKEYEYWSKQIEVPGEPIIHQPVIEEYTDEITESDYSYEFYFDNDTPPPRNASSTTTTESYATSLSAYIGRKADYVVEAEEDQKQPVKTFYNTYIYNDSGENIIENKTKILADKIKKAIDKGATVNVTLKGSASAPNSVTYNVALSQRRVDAVKKYLLGFSGLDKLEDKLNITESATGKQSTARPGGNDGPYDCEEELTGNDTTYSVAAMACRAVIIENIEEVAPEPDGDAEPWEEPTTILETITGKSETTRQEEYKETKPRDEVAKIIVKKLLNECDYFNMMREETPRVYEGIKEKLKYFHPLFHSITPEGLNTRLTFLQQCLRPGDTIPVIGEDGKPREGDVKNTAFGAPPICVLRIGDFYHTKIAIQQMSINYEPLTFDLNPEGIGVQPMLADINLSFYFIGGQGIKEPVARLQNALSFNYFANTEVYDERSVVTESREELNRQILDQIEELNGFNINDAGQVERTEEAGDTLGEITSTVITDYLEGDINYKSITNDFVKKAQSYSQNILNTLDTINKNQSLIGLYYFTQERNYKDGYTTGFLDGNDELATNIFGKPKGIPDRTTELQVKLLEDIENGTNPFLSSIALENFLESDIKKFKKKLKSFVDTYINVFQDIFNSTTFDLLEKQTEFIRVNDKINLITTETDGYRDKKGRIFILELSGTTDVDPSSSQSTTQEELLSDLQTVGFDLQEFYDGIFEDVGLIPPKDNLYKGFLTGEFNTEPQTRFCTIAYKIMTTNPEYAINLILGEELSQKPEWVQYVNKIVYGEPEVPLNLPSILGSEGMNEPILPSQPGLVDSYKELQQTSINKFKEFTNSDIAKKLKLYEPFNPDKERNFTYIQKPQEQADSSKVGYFEKTFAGANGGALDKYNLKYSFNL